MLIAYHELVTWHKKERNSLCVIVIPTDLFYEKRIR